MRRDRTSEGRAILLPDTWAGPYTGRKVTPCRRGTILSGRGNSDEDSWLRVTIIGRDPLAVTGMHHILNELPFVWLNTLTCIPDEFEFSEQDIVIWLRMRYDGMPELAGQVASLCRRHPGIKQLVISDLLPSLTPPGPGPLSGVWLARGTESCEILSALLRGMIRTPRNGPLVSRRLGRMQWRILQLRAVGECTRSIADICGISVKTVSGHESLIRERLGIRGRLEYAWLLRSVVQIQTAVPGLFREMKHLKKSVLRTGRTSAMEEMT